MSSKRVCSVGLDKGGRKPQDHQAIKDGAVRELCTGACRWDSAKPLPRFSTSCRNSVPFCPAILILDPRLHVMSHCGQSHGAQSPPPRPRRLPPCCLAWDCRESAGAWLPRLQQHKHPPQNAQIPVPRIPPWKWPDNLLFWNDVRWQGVSLQRRRGQR